MKKLVRFDKHVRNLKSAVCSKLFTVKNLFFLSCDIKVHFLKTFLLPHFEYRSSLFVYFSNTLLNKLYKLYNLCLYILLRLELNHLSIEAQQDTLKPLNSILNIFFFIGFLFFSHKFLNSNFFLLNISNLLRPVEKTVNARSHSTNLFITPFVL